MKEMGLKQVGFGFLLGFACQFIMGAYSNTQTDRELQSMRQSLEESNRYLSQISRSLDRMDDSFGSSYLRIKND